jgi:hypothetical protein
MTVHDWPTGAISAAIFRLRNDRKPFDSQAMAGGGFAESAVS